VCSYPAARFPVKAVRASTLRFKARGQGGRGREAKGQRQRRGSSRSTCVAGVKPQRTMSLDDVPDSVAALLATRLDLVDALALASTCRRFWRAAGAVSAWCRGRENAAGWGSNAYAVSFTQCTYSHRYFDISCSNLCAGFELPQAVRSNSPEPQADILRRATEPLARLPKLADAARQRLSMLISGIWRDKLLLAAIQRSDAACGKRNWHAGGEVPSSLSLGMYFSREQGVSKHPGS
jgi:hypothetical protein